MPLVGLISFILVTSLFYYGQVAVEHWQPSLNLRTTKLAVPAKFDIRVIWQFMRHWPAQPWQPLLVSGLAVTLLIYPRLLLRAITVLVSLGFVLVLSEYWDKLLLAFHRQPFAQSDPLFQTDIGFYIFTLPLLELLQFWLLGLAVLTSLAVSLVYLLSADSLSQGYFPGFSPPQARHLSQLGGWLMLMIGLSYWLDRYMLLYSSQGASYGASYTNVAVELPAAISLSLAAMPLAVWLLIKGISNGRWSRWKGQRQEKPVRKIGEVQVFGRPIYGTNYRPNSETDRGIDYGIDYGIDHRTDHRPRRRPAHRSPLLLSLSFYGLAMLLLNFGLPAITQRLVVQPNELGLEQPYIRRTIAWTRRGFKLDEIDVQTFDPNTNLTAADREANNLTLENIRLWDKNPLLVTNRQLQRIRLYYEFPDADIDRYTLPTEDGRTAQQQVLIAARELDYKAVPAAAQTWVNQHLVYTHGYGFTLSPVNTVAEGGLPDYFVRGIESTAVDPRVQSTIPIGKPRIYYGELSDTYVMTQTRVQELDYPSGDENIYNTYGGWGGVHIGNFGQRLLFAKHLRDWQMLFTDDFTPQTRLLFRRNISERVQTIAPFLRYDSNPYLVVVDTGNKEWERGYREPETMDGINPEPDESHLYWIIDAYTTSNRYPYSDPLEQDFNYIRNSVKVVVDAYHGAVNFYVADAQDPIIQAWSELFPGMFQPLEQMPPALQRHIRYPEDFSRVQSNQLMTYHMTDPIVFYNREDQWRAPNEIYGSEQQLVEPYYLIMKLPIGNTEEFILLRPFTPAQRNNLIAWLAARSDGDQYGRMLLYVFPKQELVFGPEQIEARINQDPIISERISLWNRQGSRAAQGNLLVIPVDQSLLYVEPLYLIAEQNQLPTLVRVIVAYGNRIVMAETLDQALDAIFTAEPTTAEPIIRTTDPEIPID
ncbi:MAG: COG1615 family transporter [Cyanobacteria bacterium RM1_2_2]|nr:COG1615 family transporter [Cyanobacteria bacterium RM1_2_2]